MATATSVLLQIPVPIEILQQGILLAWSYGESIIDMRMLLKGKCIPYVKTDENWQLQLSNLNKLGSEEEVVVEKEDEKGISYELFLYSLLILENKKTVSMRCLDLIEKNLNIKVDECYYAVEIQSTSKETFTTIFGYQ